MLIKIYNTCFVFRYNYYHKFFYFNIHIISKLMLHVTQYEMKILMIKNKIIEKNKFP